MVSPAKSISRLVLAAALSVSLVARPTLVAAQERETLIRDTEIEEILHKDADPILRAAGINPANVQIALIGSKELNAFAAPGVMGINTGLILQTKDPNELQGVMAHEVGHLAAGHSFRSGEMSRAGMRPFLLTMGLGVLAALAGSGDAAVGLMGSAGYFGTLGAIGYSREQEARADQAGATLLEKAGLSGKGLADFFDNFRYQEVFDEARRYKYFRDHPLSSDRIDALETRVKAQSHYSETDSPLAMAEHAIMKAKLDGFISPQEAIVKYSETDKSYPARYARAIAYYQMKEPDKALRMIDALLQEQPNNPYLWELKGQVLFEFGRAPEAEGPQRRSVQLKPEAPLLHVNLGQTLIALDDKAKVEEGVAELKKALTEENDNAEAWRLLAQAYDKQGKDGLARLATAEYEYNIGDMTQARVFAMRAREKLPKDTPDWRRATDIVLVSKPSKDDLQQLAREGAISRSQAQVR
ncbi:MAG TPA: M48 family metalloprotease [Phenylobacterium sp.]|uniref:M48 family metalloprotease n=1 Tax=Phenylobacterium sp. TaxID=1871053 RepID=UPI002B49A9C5|nr:M48 family metalloprotease [Phenylobacterium sp.]HKR87398.1 M48 family metalloprotease [Phenylobacterium sp.]